VNHSFALPSGAIIAVAAMTLLADTSTEALSYKHLPMSILGIHDINGNVVNLGNNGHGLDANGANGGIANGQAGSNSQGSNGTSSNGLIGNNTNGANG
jgi:hypothetical protein